MTPRSRRYAPKSSADICRAALRLGELKLNPKGWKFRRRVFTKATVNELIASGEAVRVGEVVRGI